MPIELTLPILQLLAYSWEDIAFEYEGLTDTERSILSREQFEELVRLMEAVGLVSFGLEPA